MKDNMEFIGKGLVVKHNSQKEEGVLPSELSELLPCPFCGANGTIEKYNGKYYAICENVRCRVRPITRGTQTDPKRAKEVWNTRAR